MQTSYDRHPLPFSKGFESFIFIREGGRRKEERDMSEDLMIANYYSFSWLLLLVVSYI